MRLIKVAAAALLVITITGCADSHFGVSEKEWNSLSEKERAAVINGYNEREMIAEKNRPIQHAISTVGLLGM